MANIQYQNQQWSKKDIKEKKFLYNSIKKGKVLKQNIKSTKFISKRKYSLLKN